MIGTIIARHMTGKIFDHLNNGDIDAFLSTLSKDAVLEFPGNLSISGEHKGHQAIRAWMEKLFSLFPERKFTVKNIYMKDIFAFGASNSAAVEFDLEAKLQDGSPYSNSYVILIHIKGGKAVRSKEFPYDFDAVKVALGE
jgi:ketosteroid isomerase-like protein